jgi:hypothetical protein
VAGFACQNKPSNREARQEREVFKNFEVKSLHKKQEN